MLAPLPALLGLMALASPPVAQCWHGETLPGVGGGQITDLAVGAGKLWISLLHQAEPVPGWGGAGTAILRLDLETGIVDDVTKALNPHDHEGPHLEIDENRQEIWVTFDAGSCGPPEGYGFDLRWHTPHDPSCGDAGAYSPPAFIRERRAADERLVASQLADIVLARDARQALLARAVLRSHGEGNSIVYLRRIGHRSARRVFESSHGWHVQSGALSSRVALVAAGPDGLVLIDRRTGQARRAHPCAGRTTVTAVATAGPRLFVGTPGGLRQLFLRELEDRVRRPAPRQKEGPTKN